MIRDACLRSVGLSYLVSILFIAPTSALGASFDCRNARTAVEKTICADAELSMLDVEMDRAYQAALNEATDKALVRSEQLEWIKNRDSVCTSGSALEGPDHSCLRTAYSYRIWKLAPRREESDRLHAGRYRVGWGWNQALCRELVSHLNEHPQWSPLACGIRIGNGASNFALPGWEPLDIRSHRDVLKSIWDEAVGPRPLMGKAGSKQAFEERFDRGVLKLSKATVDVNNTGHPLTVYRAEFDKCDPSNALAFNAPTVPRLYAVRSDGKRPASRSFKALTSPPRDIFLYKGEAHLTWWRGRYDQGVASLGIYRNSAPGGGEFFAAEPVCTISFRD